MAQVIVGHGLDAKQSDQHQLALIADAIEANLGKKPTQLSADAGYCSDANLAAMGQREIDAISCQGGPSTQGKEKAAARAHSKLTYGMGCRFAVIPVLPSNPFLIAELSLP